MKELKVGFIGLGARGMVLLKDIVLKMEEVSVTAVCDVYEERVQSAAEAVLDDNIEAQTHMLDAYPNLKSMYQPGDGNTEVYYLKNAVAQICSFTEPPKTIEF